MTLKEMAVEYRETQRKIYLRILELRRILASEHMSNSEKESMKRRVTVLRSMCDEMSHTAWILENYYKGRDDGRD
ncbi:hypothetical protein LJC01_02625 [Clostridiaceae bacterium OttesenSCG-928-D20]|nr:hypothetical protein [Clostridiaceae bacterium OttesenSCG-928-D20]